MLDESMFEDIHEIAENSAYLKAVEEKDVSLEMLEQLPAYEDLRELEEGLRAQKQLTFQNIFQEPTGYYMIKCFLIADYAVDKAIFIKDVEAYKSMRFESARRKIAKLLYQRFVSQDGDSEHKFPKGSSVFSLIRQERQTGDDDKSMQPSANGIDSKQQIVPSMAQQQQMPGQPNPNAPNGGTPTAQNNITVPGATNASANGSTIGASPAANGGSSAGMNASPAAMINAHNQPIPNGGAAQGSNGSPAQQTHTLKSGGSGDGTGSGGAIAMAKLGSSSAAGDTRQHKLSSDGKDTLHKPSNSAGNLSAIANGGADKSGAAGAAASGSDGGAAPPGGALIPKASSGDALQPGSGAPGTVGGAHGSDKEQEKTVISQNHTTIMHSHNGPHSATSVVVGGRVAGAGPSGVALGGTGLGSTSTATGGTGLGGERVEFQIGTTNNAIGVYGKIVKKVKDRVSRGEAPKDLFDEVAQQVMNDLKLDVFPRFKQSEFYKKYIRTKSIETMKVSIKDFTTFRVLGRGGFGAVHACRKTNSGTLYAMKCINKKLVKVKSALDNVLEERNVLTMMKSNFVTNLKYALQDDETLYLIMDLMLGGDLKFHLINAGRFTEKRARFYAAEVLLGLEHVHNASIIYRDMKLENVLLDHLGHCRISDLGLAVVTKTKIKGYAGTPGYTAPEMIKNKLYGPSADIFSFGVMLYRMLCGSKPFKGKIDRDLDKAVVDRKPQFPKEIFSKDAILLLTGLLHKRPENRMGCGERGIEEIKDHPFFESIDWGLLEAGYLDPPFVPNKFDVNAASLKDIGDFDKTKYKNVKLDERFRARVKNFHFVSIRALQDEMVSVLEKADENVNFEKFAPTHPELKTAPATQVAKCCTIL